MIRLRLKPNQMFTTFEEKITAPFVPLAALGADKRRLLAVSLPVGGQAGPGGQQLATDVALVPDAEVGGLHVLLQLGGKGGTIAAVGAPVPLHLQVTKK